MFFGIKKAAKLAGLSTRHFKRFITTKTVINGKFFFTEDDIKSAVELYKARTTTRHYSARLIGNK